jgi:hypothetical protein
VRRPALVLLGLLAPACARACAVCGLGLGSNGSSFFWTTVLLSLLPLGLIVAGLLYLRRVGRHWMQDEFEETDSSPVSPPAAGGAALREP